MIVAFFWSNAYISKVVVPKILGLIGLDKILSSEISSEQINFFNKQKTNFLTMLKFFKSLERGH